MSEGVPDRSAPSVFRIPPWERALSVDAALGGIYGILTGGTVLTGVLLWAGGGGFELGLLSALTTGGGLIVLVIRRLQNRFGSHKHLTTVSWVAARAAWVPLAIALAALTLFWPSDRGVVVPLLLATVLAASALAGIGNVTWYSWLNHLISRDRLGAFFAQRTRWLSVASLVSLPIVGLILDQSHVLHVEGLGFALALGSSVLCAALGWLMLRQVPLAAHPQPVAGDASRHRHQDVISAGRLAWYTGVFQVAVYLSAPFFQAYSLQHLNLSLGLLMYLQVLSQVVTIVTLGWWGRVVDQTGLRRPLALCSLGKMVVPLCYLVASPGFWWPVVGAYLLSVLDAGIGVANGAAFAHLADGPHGAARIAHLNILISVTASITPIIAGVLVAQGQIGGLETLALLFVLSAVGRGASGLVLLLPERRGWRRLAQTGAGRAPEAGSGSGGASQGDEAASSERTQAREP